MDIIKRDELEVEILPGRAIQKAVGKDGNSVSKKMTMGFARYSKESGIMEPHHHAEETVYVIDTKDGWVQWGKAPDQLEDQITLSAGMTLHIPALEWHVFEFGGDGYVDIIFFYGQVDQIRPEEMK